MNNDMIIKKTNVWGNFHNVRNVDKRIRLMKKKQLITQMEGYPFIDHYTIYAYKPKNQKGPSKEEQTFILSYAYNYDLFANEEDYYFIRKNIYTITTTHIKLLFMKKCVQLI